MLIYQNLHSHTTTSDGKISYLETLEICRQNKIGVVAFTDHDSLPLEKDVRLLNQQRSNLVKWVLGIEISSGLPIELGGKPTSNFHIVGLFINPFDLKLRKYCSKMQEARLIRMVKIVRNLKQLGLKITKEECLREAKGETINRPHIVAALIKKRANLQIIEKLKKKMKEEGEHNSCLQQKYQEMIKRGPDQYPYALFLTDQAFFPSVYVDYLYGLELDQTVKIIRDSGGVAILAHWTFYKNKIPLEMVSQLLKEKRIDGLEVIYNYHIPGLEREILTDMRDMKRLVSKYHALRSGGADSHNKKDIIDFFSQPAIARKSINLAQKIISQRKIDCRWTSLTL